jgi:hypothetical protein
MEMRRLRSAAWWVLPSLLCLAVYWYGLKAWFQQDDFAWLQQRFHIHNWHDLLGSLFRPTPHGTWRPLSERAFFLILSSLFPTEALPFRICAFLTQFANLALVSSIVWRLSGSRVAGFFAPVFWTVNSSLAQTMAWSSAYMQVLCGLFLLLAFHFLLRHIETGRWRYYWLQWIAFLAGFLAMETNIVYPLLAASYVLLCARQHFRRTLPLFVPSILFGILHMVFAPKQATGLYSMHFDLAIPETFLTYWRWALEPRQLLMLASYREWTGTVGVVLFTAGLAGYLAWAVRRREWLPVVFAAWFAILLAPVLPLREHTSAYYLTLPAMAVGMLLAQAVESARRWPAVWKAAVLVVVGAFVLIQTPAARISVRWWSQRSQEVKRLVLGVMRARELHPGKAILLTEVDDNLFGGAILDNAFRAMGVSEVYLAPGSENSIRIDPKLGRVSDFVLPPEMMAEALKRERLVVYAVGGPRLRNITQSYARSVVLPPRGAAPRRVDVGDPLAAFFLGPTWYTLDGIFRWMPKSATVRVGGPRSAAERLYVSGFCPGAQVAAGPIEMAVTAEGEVLGFARITKGDDRFTFDFSLPGKLIGRPSIEVSITLNRTTKIPGDEREIGLVFGVFEVR